MPKKPSDLPDVELLQAVFERLPGSWAGFFERFHRLMVSCAKKVFIRYGVPFTPEDLEDLVGNVCFNLVKDDFRKLRLFDPNKGYKLSSWVGLIATNTAHDVLRRRAPEHLSLDDEDWGLQQLPGPLPDPLETLEKRERMAILHQAIQQLSEADRRFVHYYYGLSLGPEAVAERMGISVNTVYSRKNKVRTKLMKLVKRHLSRVRPPRDG